MADFSMMGLLPIKANRGELGLGPKESTAGTGAASSTTGEGRYNILQILHIVYVDIQE